ncbi:Uncharacterised protein [Yersinia mollaretii]|uniref:Uncharacterized protein n=1 Tax=Yersinia mollaretii TaxID=33060 RepID=A0AA36PNW3_YERMO|nr:Uncharacterised protein [Yersinia mollaretii]
MISTVTSLPTPLVLVRVALLLSVTCNTPLPVTVLAKVPLKPLSTRVSSAPASATVEAAPRLVVEATVSLLLSASAYWPEKPLLSPVSDTFAPLLISTVEFATPLRALAIAPLSPLSTRCELASFRFTVAVAAPRLLACVTVSAPSVPILCAPLKLLVPVRVMAAVVLISPLPLSTLLNAEFAPARFKSPSTLIALLPSVPAPLKVAEAPEAISVWPLKPLFAPVISSSPPLIFRLPAPVNPPVAVEVPPAFKVSVPPARFRILLLVIAPVLVNAPPLPKVTVPALVSAPTV